MLHSAFFFSVWWSSLIGICEGIRVELIVRGEALDFVKDELLRNHLPRMFSLIKNEVRGSKTIRYRRSLNHKPCRLENGESFDCDSFSKQSKFWVLGGVWSQG